MNPGKVKDRGDLADKVILWHRIIEIERIGKLPLILLEPPHHYPSPPQVAPGSPNHGPPLPTTDFCNKIGPG
jgi:hypothetical protein